MTNSYYNATGNPASATLGRAANIRAEFAAIGAGFDAVEAAVAAKAAAANPSFTGAMSNAVGSASLPSYTFTGDTNTGVYSPGADQWAVATAGVKRFEVDSTGRLGFGTATLSNAWKYTVVSATSTSTSEYGDYTVLSASNTSGAVAKIAFAGVARAVTAFAGTGSIVGVQGVGDITNAVTVATLYGVQGVLSTAAAGTLTTGAAFTYAASNGGSATITNLLGYLAPDITATATLVAGYYGAVTTGTGKWNLYIPGSAQSYHAGRFMVGTATENTSGAKLQTSDGITFPATAVASTDANTLDDYEEGSWTPRFEAFGSTFSYAIQAGHYTKIGNMVFLNGYIKLNGAGNTLGGSTLHIENLPFNGKNHGLAALAYGTASWVNMATAVNAMWTQMPNNSSQIYLPFTTAAATTVTNMGASAMSPTLGTELYFTIAYPTA